MVMCTHSAVRHHRTHIQTPIFRGQTPLRKAPLHHTKRFPPLHLARNPYILGAVHPQQSTPESDTSLSNPLRDHTFSKAQAEEPQNPEGQSPASWQNAAVAKLRSIGTVGWSLIACGLLCVLLAPSAQAAAAAASTAGSGSFSLTGAARGLLDFALHLDKHLSVIIAEHGRSTYGILFAIVFAETGLVLTPFLPGDSLLFAAGAFAGLGSLHAPTLLVTFITAAFLGDAVNYAVGHFLGTRAVNSGIIKQEYLTKTEKFYSKYGGKTVVLARFVPIIRTFAPFVAGVGNMEYSKFAWYNIAGAVLWSVLFVGAGYFLGNLPFVQHNFTLVVLAIVLISVLPIAFELIAARREQKPSAE